MSYPIETLEPKAVWHYFNKIRQIPHGSGNEQKLASAIVSWAEEKGCDTSLDDKGNLVVRVPPTKGCEQAPTLVLQGHLDMVCEKNAETVFDFEKDPLVLRRDEDWISADGTTLGSDNGIGVATALAFLDVPDAVHGPLEFLFTVEEETGLFGAQALAPGFLKGRLMFNLDSEEDGVFYVGCAGGRDSHLTLPLTKTGPPADGQAVALEIKGLRGGHSGLDIIQNRGCAPRLLARALRALTKEISYSLASIDGGDKHNAIPREASAVIVVAPADAQKLPPILEGQLRLFREEFASAEPELSLSWSSTELPAAVLDESSMKKALQLIIGLPHGVSAMVRDLVGMVETSTNLARVRTEDTALTILKSSRSSVASALEGVINQIESVGEAVGAEVEVDDGYPGWMPNMDSKMLARAKKIWRDVHGAEASFQVIHAGLECGIIGEKYPGMDMISLGPTIMNPHSPEEKISISTVQRFFEFVRVFVASFGKA